jgi:hypothetical protein
MDDLLALQINNTSLGMDERSRRGTSLVFADKEQTRLDELKCSACQRTKSLTAFPPSCATWRRGACRECRRAAWQSRSIFEKKLAVTRVKVGSTNAVRPSDVERFSSHNMMWVTARQPGGHV